VFEKIYLGAVSILSIGTAFVIGVVLMKYFIQWEEIFIFFKYIFAIPGAD
jgi:hypothetical protein|tara:strand:+ start:837 stop:986 length:150 start_codon:yes stop_codon:yes gene_type:complete